LQRSALARENGGTRESLCVLFFSFTTLFS
jgi:hypothetical protein